MSGIDFFSKLGFDFNRNLKSKELYFEKYPALTAKLQHSVYFYLNPNQTNTSFYLLTSSLSDEEIEIVRKYIWNKNDADLIFYASPEQDEVIISYAKYSPLVSYKDSVLERFNASDADLDKIEKIKHWQFDSGAFWLNYHSFISTSKYKGIDKELVSTLSTLKNQLNGALLNLTQDNEKRSEIVQALIDRTLYIKYLEDNHIINSAFYRHYFNDDSLTYKQLLYSENEQEINRLFKIIHEIFNNNLFDHPTVEPKYLSSNICNLIAQSFNTHNGQLRLFDFQFDVLPIEFISNVYEVFLSEKQKANGIYYTPKKLAQLIVDDVICENEIGSVLDPSCGSGMFLTVAFQKLLEISKNKGSEPENNLDKIKFRTKLLSENIFGIEKETIAQRFTLFSLSLQIFKDISPSEIKEYIASKLKTNNKIDLFSEYSFFENIICANTLSTEEEKIPFRNKIFKYIVGNPPFFEISDTQENRDEISFLNNYKVTLENGKVAKAKDIVGKHQISQCFFLKLKDLSDSETRFGFVSNSSNFYNDNSIDFQKYFYTYYGIEKIYELSRVKNILFEKAKESVVALVFTNSSLKDTLEYYPIDLGLFSEKPFELLIIQEDKAIDIKQGELQKQEIKLRDFLIGNKYDRTLIMSFKSLKKLDTHLDLNQTHFRGLERIENVKLAKFFNLSVPQFNSLTREEKNKLHTSFSYEKYLSDTLDFGYIPYIYSASKITPFRIEKDFFIKEKEITNSNFRRYNSLVLFDKKKILLNRFGGVINAAFSENAMAFSTYIYCITLNDDDFYHLITAILNSWLCNYYLDLSNKKRIDSNYTNIDVEAIKKIPIPKEINQEIVNKISIISKSITEEQENYSNKAIELNELIFNLYDLSYIERQRIKDYFLPKEKITIRKKDCLDSYKSILEDSINIYLNNPIGIEITPTDFDLIVVKVLLNKNNSDKPSAGKAKRYILNEVFEQNPTENFLATQEKIFGEDCVYIIKKNINQNWTETKAFEDGQDILNHLIIPENGERIHQD